MAVLLFAYGTLCDRDLLAAVLKRPLGPAAILPAVAPGFRAVHYPDRSYPALVRRPGGTAQGVVLTDLSRFELDLLDAFEGLEYRRTPIPVMIEEELHEAFAYLPTVMVGADSPDWILADWQATHKHRVLAGDAASAELLRAKLIAIRPN